MDFLLGFIILLLKIAVMLGGLLLAASYLVWLERKLLARFQVRYGPNRAGPKGLLQPIADLMKTQVYALAKELNIIEEIRNATPTDGLWEDGRSDESQIGATYAELEWAMDHLDNPPEESLTGRQEEVIEIYKKFHTANRHKMEAIPVCQIPKNLMG